MATHANQEFYLGEDWAIDIVCHGPDDNVLDLTGGDVQFRLSRIMRGRPPLISLSVIDGVTLTEPVAGVAAILVTPAMQAAAGITPGLYAYEIRAVDTDDVVSEQADGTFNVRAGL